MISFTWYRDEWYVLIGHHPWRAALLHIEVSCLEKSPAETQMERSTVRHSEEKPHTICTQDATLKSIRE